MKNKIIFMSFILSAIFCQFLSASEIGQLSNGRHDVDVPVFHDQLAPEGGQIQEEHVQAEDNDAEVAQSALQETVRPERVDVFSAPVFYYRSVFENNSEGRPLTPAEDNDAEVAREALIEAVQSGGVKINPGDSVSLTFDRQDGEVFVTVSSYDINGAFVETVCDRISDGRN
ncbi:MAG: hypothetical protein WC747_02010 [Candidatus Babeliales bacterium]|jgi:hypothetical protein